MQRSIPAALLAVIACCAASVQGATIEVSQPVPVTSDSHYERGQSVVYDGASYWLFYGRSASVTGNYQNADPDVNDYAVYCKTAATIADLASATPEAIPGATNSYLGETGAAYFGNEVWTFAAIVSGATADLNGWYYDGAAWNQVSSIATGLSAASAYHDETEFGGELFVVVCRDSLYTMHSATPKTGGWSTEVQVNAGADAGGGPCRFFKHGSSLYLAVFRSDAPAANMVFEYNSGTDTWAKIAETASTGGDPTLFRVGGTYVFAQSPWVSSPDGGHRYLITWLGGTPATVFDAPSRMACEAAYDSNTWTATRPFGFTDEEGAYLFYTSERAQAAQEGTGNIWYLRVGWRVENEHYTYIRNAIAAANAGDAVDVAAGTYHNDFYTLSKSITLRGANADIDPAGSTDRGGETILTRDDPNAFTIQPAAAGATINGFHFGTPTAASGRHIYIADATDVTVSYSIFENSSGYGVAVGPNADRAQVSYNAVHTSASEGIVNLGGADVVISGNTVENVDTFAIRTSGRAAISANVVSHCRDGIRVEYAGTGAGDRVEVSSNTVSYTEYAGISVNGAHAYIQGNVLEHCNYYGSDGFGDWDYASIHLEPGATNCIIHGNRVHDGINGIQTWANDVTITSNYIYDMGATYGAEKVIGGRTYKNAAILVGSNWGSGDYDPTGVTIQNNAIQDNYWGLFYSADLTNGVVAESNWWGDATGPYDPNGLNEVDGPADCNADPAQDKNADGMGDALSENIDYCPWLNSYARLTLEPDADCYPVGETVTVEVWMRDITETIVSGQFYLEYDDAVLTLVSVDPGDATATDPNNPFEVEIYECSTVQGGSNPQCDPLPGLIDYAVGIPGGATGVAGDAKLAVIMFTTSAAVYAEQELIAWRPHIPPNRLADDSSNPVYPLLVDLDIADDESPVVSGLTVAGGDVDGNCEYTVTFSATASDNCCLDPNSVVVNVALQTANATLGTPIVNKTPNGSGGIDIDGSVVVSDLTSCSATVQVAVFATDCAVHASGEAGADPIDGRWTESYPSYPADDDSVVNAASWDGSALGTEWLLAGPTRIGPPELLWDTHSSDPNDGGEMVWRTHHTGGTLWLSGTPTADVVRHTHIAHDVYVGGSIDYGLSWTDMVTHAVVPSLGTGLTLTGVAHLEGSGSSPDPNYPDFEPGHTYGQWGRVESLKLTTLNAGTADASDLTPPAATAPTDVAVQCETDVPAGVATYAEYMAAGGTASDNCTADDDLLIEFADGPLTGGPCGGTITRTYTITDQCGNASDVLQTITVNDTTPPTATPPTDVTVECESDVPAAATTYAEFVALGGTASDNCTASDDLVVTHVDGTLTGGPCGGTITRTYTVMDACSNGSDVLQTITIDDTTAPTATAPADMAVECLVDVPAATNYAEFVAQGGTASDNCTAGDDLIITHSDTPLSGPCPATITRTYTIIDACGNDYSVDQTLTIQDTTPPAATPPPDVTVECETDAPAAATTYAEFVAQGGTASDNCTPGDGLTITHSDGPLTGGPCGGTITRTYTITDECANDYQVQQTITVYDTIAPTFTRPSDITMNADAGDCTLTLTLAEIGSPTDLNDNCTAPGDLLVSWTRSDDATNLDDPFIGTTTITWQVEDACGNFETNPLLTVQTVTVLEFNDLVVSVALKDIGEPALSRCITFEVWDCTIGTAQTVDEVITFANGVATSVLLDVPCGVWTCIRARDPLHTLWRTDLDDFGIAGRQYVADLTDQSGAGGDDDALVGGNLYDDVPPYAPPQFIDIMDYAVFVNNWAVDYGGGDTDCNDVPFHADISGDGTVETGDFTFIQTYFAFVDDPDCCGLFSSGDGPRTEISVDELYALGLDELVLADLNLDGWVDTEDVLAFANGARPGLRPAEVGPATLDRARRTDQPTDPRPAPPREP